MEFQCSLCYYTSELKVNVLKHINRQNKCGEGVAEILEIEIEIKCEFCEKEFNTVPSMKRHLKTCKVKKSKSNSIEKELKFEG